ncbi:hypothetical protein D7W81_06055 [Corallococcus aberystwythensis]|uniref:Uncharacterized protein n=1 Tax=Corallococcus aberystwythensis TaxID=2316722 RepID=A0A3A8QX76_9BACT|nr:hypothetical protein D7W81_06055 [Corallococcus aberystwythensis]
MFVPLAGRGLDVGVTRPLFAVGGLLFWPGYILLVRRWLRSGKQGVLWALLAWCVFGFFQVVHKFVAAMSV